MSGAGLDSPLFKALGGSAAGNESSIAAGALEGLDDTSATCDEPTGAVVANLGNLGLEKDYRNGSNPKGKR